MKENSAGRRNIFLCIVIAILVLVMAVFFVRAERNALAKKAGNSLWKITEYATVTPNQCMFYTVEDSRGRLAVIDGGFEEDADQVLGVIRAHGNHVYDWIITHPHPDHVGALNAILTQQSEGKLSDVVIDHIYTTKVNKKRYEETAHDYDGIDAFEKFYNLTNGRKKLSYLEENDEEDILGLKMKVLHAWDSHVDDSTGTYDAPQLKQYFQNHGVTVFSLADAPNMVEIE